MHVETSHVNLVVRRVIGSRDVKQLKVEINDLDGKMVPDRIEHYARS